MANKITVIVRNDPARLSAVPKVGNTVSTKVIQIEGAVPTPRRFDELLDVVENHPPDKSTIVYNANTDKYEVKPLDLGNFEDVNLDGGEF